MLHTRPGSVRPCPVRTASHAIFNTAWLFMLLLALGGCNEAATQGKRAATAKRPDLGGPAASQIMAKMQAVYRQCKSFGMNAETVQQYVHKNDGVEREVPLDSLAFAFERPNQIVYSYETVNPYAEEHSRYDLRSDGKQLRAGTNETPEQVFECTAPLNLTLQNYFPEPRLRVAIYEELWGGVQHPQISMLLSSTEKEAAPLFPGQERPKRLGKQKLGEFVCYRLAIGSKVGEYVLWIDVKTHLLMRMELPKEAQHGAQFIERDLVSSDLVVNYNPSLIDPALPAGDFVMQVPSSLTRVKKFVEPAPSKLPGILGQMRSDFEFETLEGKRFGGSDLKGKVVVLDFWHTTCPPCKVNTPVLQQAYTQLKDEADIAFLAVSTDPAEVKSQEVESTLERWGGTFKILRDPMSRSMDIFKLRYTPSLIVLGRDGRVQYLHVGPYGDEKELVKTIKDIVAGEDLAGKDLATYAKQLDNYKQRLKEASLPGNLLEVEVTSPEIAEQKLPEKFAVKEIWSVSSKELAKPGNLSVIDSDGETRVAVLDGGQAVVEYDLKGQKVARHDLPDNVEVAGGFLRSAVDSEGDRWIAISGVGWQKVHLFDALWKHQTAFPKSRHAGIGDVALVELTEGDELSLVVGYWGGVGVQGVSLAGKRQWSDRTLDQVVQVVAAPTAAGQARQVWCLSDRGSLLPLDAEGKRSDPLVIADQSVMFAAVGTEADEPVLCGLSVSDVGQYRAIGFTPQGKVAWQYDLPKGEYAQQVTRLQASELPGAGMAWLVAAADGSIHWLSSAGKLLDSFAYGKELNGVAMTNQGDSAILLVSTAEGLAAWSVQAKAEPKAEAPVTASSAEPPSANDKAKEAATETPEAEQEADSDEPAEPAAQTESPGQAESAPVADSSQE